MASQTTTKTYLNNDKNLTKRRQKLKVKVINNDKNLTTIAQHNDLVFARYSLSYWEMRIFICLLAQIRKEDEEFKAYQIPINLLCENAKGGMYETIVDASYRLLGRRIQFYDKENEKWIGRTLMAECSYQKGSGYVNAKFNELMKPYLLQLQGNFTLSALKQVNLIKSYYSFRLYHILRTRLLNDEKGCAIKDKNGYILKLGFLKHVLELDGQYPRFYDFNKRVLKSAQKDLAKTDLAFTYKPIKEGKSIDAIMFHIVGDPKPVQLKLFNALEEQPEIGQEESKNRENKPRPISEILERWGLSRVQAAIISKASDKAIYKTNHEMQIAYSDLRPLNKAAWAYTEFIKRLGLKEKIVD